MPRSTNLYVKTLEIYKHINYIHDSTINYNYFIYPYSTWLTLCTKRNRYIKNQKIIARQKIVSINS